jgi:hypothetical protein
MLVACVVSLLAIAAHAATLNVGPGQTYTTIQSAINAAKDYDTVLVAPGTYTENIDFLGKWITVTSSGGAAVTIIDGSGKSAPAVTIESGGTHTTTQGVPSFIGFTVQNGGTGKAATRTGGIYVNLSNGTISNNVLTHNHCAGLWVVMLSTPPTVQNNEVDNTTDNYDCPAGGGSGIVVSRNSSGCVNCANVPVILTGNTVQNNVYGGHEGQGGGGITVLGGVEGAQIQNNTIRYNTSAGIGGGIFLAISNAEVVQNLVYGNQVACGGAGVATERTSTGAGSGTLLLANNTVASNTLAGGACTVTQAGNASQLLFADEGSLTYPALVLNNIVSGSSTQPSIACAFANDAAAGLRDTPVFDHNLFFNSGGAVLDTVSCTDPQALLTDLNADPQFVNAGTSPLQIAVGSPAVDAGNNNALVLDNASGYFTVNTATDFGGSPRLADATGKGYATVDLGAYELAATTDTPQTSVSLTVANVSGENFLLTAAGGSSIDLIAYVTSPVGGSTGCTGAVSFLEDGASIGSVNIGAYTNTATLKGVFLAPGTHHFAASYGGQSPCSAGVSVPVIYLVSNYAPSLTLTSSLNPALLGQAVTFTATIASADPAQGGPISLTDGGTVLATLTPNASGVATFTTSTLALGSHPIQASYAANTTHNAASAGLTQYIVSGSIATTVTLSSSENPAALGDTVTFTATVGSAAGTPTGSVQFAEGATVYATVPLVAGYGSAQWSTSTLSLGQHVITATLIPTGLYSGSVGSLTEFIARATTTTLTITASGAVVTSVPSGTAVTLTATVASSGAAVKPGQVQFCDAAASYCTDIHLLGTAQLTAAGTATLKFTPGAGSHSYYAAFTGTNAYAASVSANVPLKVVAVKGPQKTTVGIQASGGPGDYSLLGTVATNGTASPTGTISFLDTTNANYVLGSATLGPTGSTNISFLNTENFPLPRLYGIDTSGGGFAVGDFNGDGIPDMVVDNSSQENITVLLGNGDGTFRTGTVISLGTTPGTLVAGDFNHDGKLDFVVTVGNITAAGLAVYLGNGDGTFNALPLIAANDTYGGALLVADFNDDGFLDIAVSEVDPVSTGGGNCFSGTENCWLQIFSGNGDGTFTALPNRTPTILAFNLVPADFNGDGKVDLAITGSSPYTSILLGNGDGTFTAAPNVAGGDGIVAADFNGDGSADLAVNNQGTTFILLGNGDGTFTQLPDNPSLDLQAASLAVGEFNGDGIPDLVVPDVNGGDTNVFMGKGDGTFKGDAFSPSLAGFLFDHLAVADFNGDGQSDFAAYTNDGNTNDNPPMDQLRVFLAQAPSTAAAYVYNISPVGMGLHYVDASYAGDSNNLPGVSNTIPLVAEPVVTALMLAVNPSSSSGGQAVTLTATLSPFFAQNHYASGNVIFTSNGKTLGTGAVSNGVATLTTTALALGTDNLLAKYPGDMNFVASVSSIVPIVVGSAQTVLTLTSSLNPAPVQTPVTFTVNLTANGQPVPAGSTISLSLNGQAIVLTTDASGNATYTTSSLPVGSDPVTASFGGSASLLASSAALTEVIQLLPTTTTLVAAPNPAYQGQTVTLTATVAAGAQQALGNVTFYDGGTVLGSAPLASQSLNGPTVAVLTVSTLAVGTHPLTATCAAGAVLAGSSSAVVQEVVLASSFTLALSPTSLTMRGGQTATAAIQLASVGNFAGPVSLSVGALPTYATATISPASVTLAAAGTGASTLTIKTMQHAENIAPPRPGMGPGSQSQRWPVVVATLLLLLPYGGNRRAGLRGGLRVAVGLLWVGVLVQGLTGCTNAYYTDLVVAPGSYPVTVTGTDQSGSKQSATLTVVITP